MDVPPSLWGSSSTSPVGQRSNARRTIAPMVASEPIDLHHQGADRVIGCYLLETSDGLALNDCGPAVCVASLARGLADRGVSLQDIDHLLLSHIHLDHAGAAGVLVREQPRLQVHVSAGGAPPLLDPSRLGGSAP